MLFCVIRVVLYRHPPLCSVSSLFVVFQPSRKRPSLQQPFPGFSRQWVAPRHRRPSLQSLTQLCGKHLLRHQQRRQRHHRHLSNGNGQIVPELDSSVSPVEFRSEVQGLAAAEVIARNKVAGAEEEPAAAGLLAVVGPTFSTELKMYQLKRPARYTYNQLQVRQCSQRSYMTASFR